MTHPSTEPFYVRRNRKVSQILFDTLRFMAKNGNTLVLSTGMLAVPLIVISRIAVRYIIEDPTPFDRSVFYMNDLGKTTFVLYWLLFILFVLGLGLFNMLLNKFMALSDASPGRRLSAHDIRHDVTSSLKTWMPNFFIIFVLYYVLWHLIPILSGMQDEYNATLDPDSDGISYYSQLLVPYLPVIVVLPFIIYALFASLYLCFRDGLDTTAVARRLWEMTRVHYRRIFLGGGAILITSALGYYLLQKLLFVFFSVFSMFSMPWFLYLAFDLLRFTFSFALIAFMQIACILLLGTMEEDAETQHMRNRVDQIET